MKRFAIGCFVGLLAAVLVGGAGAQQAGNTDDASATLRQATKGRLLIGTAIMSANLDDPRHARLIASQFNSIAGGNEFKPDALQREKGKFTFERADKIVAFAEKHDMKVIGHTLVWHSQAPRWLFEDESGRPLPREQALENLKNHIETVVTHFKGRVLGWDVVNEAISDRGDEYLRDTPARRAIGDDYIQKAFEFAHAADPNVELYYNDYNIEREPKLSKTIRLVRELKASGIRVDAVGIQGHWLLEHPEIGLIDRGIAALKNEGVKVMITELDIDVLPRRTSGADVSATEAGGLDPYKAGLPPEIAQRQASRYEELFKVFLKHQDAITRVTFWGTTDGHTWLNNWPTRGRTNHPMLWDRQFQPKPAFHAVIGVLNGSTDQ